MKTILFITFLSIVRSAYSQQIFIRENLKAGDNQKTYLIYNKVTPVFSKVLSIVFKMNLIKTDYRSPGNSSKLLAFKRNPFIIFQSEKPQVSIVLPQQGDTLLDSKLRVTGTTSDIKGVVKVRVNKGPWKQATISKSYPTIAYWEIDLELDDKNTNNTIQAIAISQNQESSEIETVKNIIYRKNGKTSTVSKSSPVALSVNPLFPKEHEVAGKCVNNYNYHYKFKFSVFDPKIKRDNIKIVVENTNHQIFMEETLGSLIKKDRECLRTIKVSENRVDYCLFLIYSDLRFKDPCEPDDEDNFYYFFKYDEQSVPTEKVLIHFPSFDSKNEVQCDCN